MMSLETIRKMSDEAGAKASKQNKQPYVLFDRDDVERMPGGAQHSGRAFPFPNLGSYEPEGWEEVDRLFVDSSGFGSPSEPALTIDQLNRKLVELVEQPSEVGIAIVEEGQFQIYLGVFQKTLEAK